MGGKLAKTKKQKQGPATNQLDSRSSKKMRPDEKLLMEACIQGDVKKIEQLLQKGMRRIRDLRFIRYAIGIKFLRGTFYKLQVGQLNGMGLDPNAQDREGNTAMHYCARNCYRHVVRQLAMHGAHKSVFLHNREGQYPADMVNMDKNKDIDEQMEIRHVFLQLQYAPDLDQSDE